MPIDKYFTVIGSYQFIEIYSFNKVYNYMLLVASF